MEPQAFLVSYKRLGPHRNVRQVHIATSVGALEAPIKEYVETVLGHGQSIDVTVTIDTDALTGQLDYGLKGEFTIQA